MIRFSTDKGTKVKEKKGSAKTDSPRTSIKWVLSLLPAKNPSMENENLVPKQSYHTGPDCITPKFIELHSQNRFALPKLYRTTTSSALITNSTSPFREKQNKERGQIHQPPITQNPLCCTNS